MSNLTHNILAISQETLKVPMRFVKSMETQVITQLQVYNEFSFFRSARPGVRDNCVAYCNTVLR